jgi:hypothetical protein
MRKKHLPGAPEIWAMEKEHILPFAVGKRLWQLVNLARPGRKGHEDTTQMTILIYKGAADEKTAGDAELWNRFESSLANGEVQRRLTTFRVAREGGIETSEGPDLVAKVFQVVRELSDDAVGRTARAAENENRSHTQGSALTNGQRRGKPGGPELPIPAEGEIKIAASAQYDQVLNLLEQVVADVNEGRRPNITPERR